MRSQQWGREQTPLIRADGLRYADQDRLDETRDALRLPSRQQVERGADPWGNGTVFVAGRDAPADASYHVLRHLAESVIPHNHLSLIHAVHMSTQVPGNSAAWANQRSRRITVKALNRLPDDNVGGHMIRHEAGHMMDAVNAEQRGLPVELLPPHDGFTHPRYVHFFNEVGKWAFNPDYDGEEYKKFSHLPKHEIYNHGLSEAWADQYAMDTAPTNFPGRGDSAYFQWAHRMEDPPDNFGMAYRSQIHEPTGLTIMRRQNIDLPDKRKLATLMSEAPWDRRGLADAFAHGRNGHGY